MGMEILKTYNAFDSLATQLCMRSLLQELKEQKLEKFYFEHVMPIARVLIDINAKGMYIDQEMRSRAIREVDQEIEQLQQAVNEMVGREINVDGNEFVDFLFNEVGLKPVARTAKTRKPSLKKDALFKLMAQYPDIALLFETVYNLKKKRKLKSTFLEGIEPDDDGRVHPSYRIGPVSGRVSCKKPNFNNIPEGISRKVFVAPPGYALVFADYSQIELRVMAVLSGAKALLDAFARGEDVHERNARLLFGIPPGQAVSKRQRFFAKMFVFALIYGASVSGEGLIEVGAEMFHDVPRKVVEDAGRRFLEANPEILQFRAKIKAELIRTKRLVNVYGRPRVFFGEIKDVLRAAYNTPIQSAAADTLNRAMIKVAKRWPKTIVLQVYDSLMMEVREEAAQDIAGEVKEILEAPVPEFGGYSFPAKVSVVHSWGDA